MTRQRQTHAAVLLVAIALTALCLTITATNATVLYAYDDLGRVTSITYDDGQRITYSYDAAGNRTQHTQDAVANQFPIAVQDDIVVDVTIGTTQTVAVLANDSDPDLDFLTIQSVTPPSVGTAVILGGGSMILYTYTGSLANVPTPDGFTYTVSDGRGGTATATVSVSVFASCVPPPGQEFCGL